MSKFNPLDWAGDSVYDVDGDGKLNTFEDAVRDRSHMEALGMFDEDEYVYNSDEEDWYDDVENGDEYGIFPEDFDSEEAYNEALADVKSDYDFVPDADDDDEYDMGGAIWYHNAQIAQEQSIDSSARFTATEPEKADSEQTSNNVPEQTHKVSEQPAADVPVAQSETQTANQPFSAPQPDVSPVLQQPAAPDSSGAPAQKKPLTTRQQVLAIVLATLGLVLLGVIIYASVFTPEKEYKRAVDSIVAGDYERAERLLGPLSQKNYAQASEYLRFCRDLQKMKKGERVNRAEYDLVGEYMPEGISTLYEKLILYEICYDNEYIYYNGNSFESRDFDLYGDETEDDDDTSSFETTTQAEDSQSDSAGGYGRGYGGSVPYAGGGGDDTAGDGSSSDTTKAYDAYHASDYIDPEDFYDEYYDDFYDYEDAEDYWYEHQE